MQRYFQRYPLNSAYEEMIEPCFSFLKLNIFNGGFSNNVTNGYLANWEKESKSHN